MAFRGILWWSLDSVSWIVLDIKIIFAFTNISVSIKVAVNVTIGNSETQAYPGRYSSRLITLLTAPPAPVSHLISEQLPLSDDDGST